ncbi:MAG: hypothetical protein KAW12_13740 [Candidatus Aminicenantes bacterium]|nr:hypothetical protein [Candidatus Aminicenantes bacterium]
MTSLKTLIETENSGHVVLSPAVGNFSMAHKSGVFLGPGAFVGRLRVLNSYYDLYLPAKMQGLVEVDDGLDWIIPVAYGQELFRLDQQQLAGAGEDAGAGQSGKDAGSQPEEGYVVTAFTNGIFYSKPSPDAPPFVSEGERVEKGKALGLIEVMKTFNRILFQGTDQGDSGIIKKVYVEDSEEVKSGQPLFLIE